MVHKTYFLNKKEILVFLAVAAIAITLRLINIGMPILEGTTTRQVQTAMIARNFFYGGFSLLYPTVDFMAPGPGFLLMEFPLLNVLIAGGYVLAGGVYEWIGRLISVAFFAGALGFLYALVKSRWGRAEAVVSCLVFSLSPLSIIFSRAIMPDFEMLFFLVGALYCMQRHSDNNRIGYLFLSGILFALSLLSKIQSFYIGFVLVYLFLEKEPRRAAIHIRHWLALLLPCLLAAGWYLHAGRVHRLYVPYQAYNFTLSNWFKPAWFFNADYLFRLLWIIAGQLLTPAGFILFLAGICMRQDSKKYRLAYVWLGATAIYMLLFNTHLRDPYYHLPLLPIAGIFIARAILWLGKRKGDMASPVLKIMVFIAIITTALVIVRYLLHAYRIPKGYRDIPEIAGELKKLSHQDDLIAVSEAGGLAILYYSQRRGRTILPDKDSLVQLEKAKNEGFRWLVLYSLNKLYGNEEFMRFIRTHYDAATEEKGRYIIIRLAR